MNLHKGTAALPPVLARVQKVVADIQLRGVDNLMDLPASKVARVHGDTLVDSLDLSYQKMSITSEGG